MKTDIQNLEKLAKDAGPNDPWYKPGDLRYADDKTGGIHGLDHHADDFIAAANPAAVLELIAENDVLSAQVKTLQSEANSYQSGYDSGRRMGVKTALAERDQLKAEVEALRATVDLQKLLPEVSDALEELEMHGQHSDQGYRKLRDWYRKVELAYRVITAPMFGADHAELVSQNTWLRKMVGHQAEQHAPMEPIADPEGWSRRLPGYDLPALLRDAERYRYLRTGAYSFENSRREVVAIEDLDAPKDQFPSGAEMLDAAVDIAMSKESGND
ncbi:hypothetical protein [Pseudomonas sp. PS02290]|uniref:hypothetical protein n=1 Tax=Pseudomonas sp. PS02290 TaxID=2991430 RepID=UPI00249C4CCA|nr:hypothetical protein [Pseudomonas sp. PS02290]